MCCKKEKIVHVFLTGPMNDGWTYQENLLSKYHKKLGFDVTFITTQMLFDEDGSITYTNKTNYNNNDGVKVIRLPVKNKICPKRLYKYNGLYNALIEERPDIIFFHCFQCRDSKTIVEYAKRHRVIIYADNHADYSNSAKTWLSKYILHKIIWKYYTKKLIPYVKTFYGVLPIRVKIMHELYDIPKEKTKLLVMGGDDDAVNSVSADMIHVFKMRNQIKQDDFLIVTGGKIDAFKTQTLLLMRAVNDLEMDNIKLLVFGSVAEDIKDEFMSLLSNTVKYIGWVKPEDTYLVFGSADLVVFPGRHSVFWEQVAAQGIPLMVRHWEGTDHIDVGGNVEFIYNDSIQEIKEKISKIVSDNNYYNEMRKVANDKGKKIFSYYEIAKRCLEE